MVNIVVGLSEAPLIPGAIDVQLAEPCDSGARVVFCGQARDEGGVVDSLFVEHFPSMTEASLRTICEQAAKNWPVKRIVLVHRIGHVGAGDDLVQVGVSADHRQQAFLACTFIMDYLKTQAPFWKKEIGVEGEHWVEAKTSDAEAAERWKKVSQDEEHER